MTIIKKAKINDAANIAKMAVALLKYHANFDPYFAPINDAENIYAKYFKKCIYSPTKQLLVAECDGKLAGYALIEITSRPPVFKVKNMGLVNDIFVVAKFRRKGVGKELFIGMLDWIKSKKPGYKSLDYIELSVNIKDIISQKAWAKYGFKEYISKQRMKI
ncbi:MAG: GNAT family N-acetyltransferase [Patescibacteria group bacterium]|jgi:GNAT superfamily N-acetyltransferase